MNKPLCETVLKIGGGIGYYQMANASGKVWFMPLKAFRMGMMLYHPGSWRGKVFKNLCLWFHNVPVCKNFFGKQISLQLQSELLLTINKLFHVGNLDLAIFCGTPSVHQKITIQVSSQKQVLGYVKVSDQLEIGNIFEHEKTVLDTMHLKGISHIPVCKYCGKMSNGLYLFVQDAEKSQRMKHVISFSPLHRDILDVWKVQTQQTVLFEDTDFAKYLQNLSMYLDGFLPDDQPLIEKCLASIQQYYGTGEVTFSLYHGDFTPWNSYVVSKAVYAFDFEYARWLCPPYMDVCHFILQSAHMAFHYPPHRAYVFLQENISHFFPEIPDSDYFCMSYLLYNLSFYFHLYCGRFDTRDESYSYWISLLRENVDHIHRSEKKGR